MESSSGDPAAKPGPQVIVMGVTGCGKTTVGIALAERLGVPFRDGDDFHPQANIDKMASGQPLNDDDRWPWLEITGQWMHEQAATGSVVGCSALRVVYRDLIRKHAPGTVFVHLHGPAEVVTERVAQRKGHFMPASLVQSQYDTLEMLEENEAGVVIDFSLPVDEIVDRAVEYLNSSGEQGVTS